MMAPSLSRQFNEGPGAYWSLMWPVGLDASSMAEGIRLGEASTFTLPRHNYARRHGRYILRSVSVI